MNLIDGTAGNFPFSQSNSLVLGTQARFNSPLGILWYESIQALYISDTLNNNVKIITLIEDSQTYFVAYSFYASKPIGLLNDGTPTFYAIGNEDGNEYYINNYLESAKVLNGKLYFILFYFNQFLNIFRWSRFYWHILHEFILGKCFWSSCRYRLQFLSSWSRK